MSKVERYLEAVPLPVLLLGPILALAVFLLIPARLRLPAVLAVLMVWLTLGEMMGLGVFQGVAKTTAFAAYGLVAVAAWLDPGPRRPLVPAAWGHVGAALLGFAFIWTVSDVTYAFAVRLQWLLLVVAAFAVARTIVDEASLMRVGASLAVGMAVALLVPLSDLVLHPGDAFKYGLRFSPYDTNANHIGVLFALAAPLALYGAMRAGSTSVRGLCLAACGAAAGMGLLTASRSTMAVMVGASLPLAMALTRRPAATAVSGGLILAALYVALEIFAPDTVAIERLGSLETTRLQTGREYVGIIAEHPFFGLMEMQGGSYTADQELQSHAHNGYLETLYQGGLAWGLPVFAMVAYTSWCTFVAWRRRREIGAEPVLVNLLIAIMVMTYAHGFVNHSLFWPTTILGFVHILLSTMFMGFASDLRQGLDPLPAAVPGGEDGWGGEGPYPPQDSAPSDQDPEDDERGEGEREQDAA